MGSSKIQALLISLILTYLFKFLDREKYIILTNETGFKWGRRNWRSLDIAIFEKEKLLKEGINDKFVNTPPEVVIEIDTKADLRKYGDFMNYAREKTQDLLDAGVKKIIWYTTFDKKVMVAEKGTRWFITDWDDPIEIINGITLNIKELLEKEGIKI